MQLCVDSHGPLNFTCPPSSDRISVLTAFSRWTWVSRCLLKQRMMEGFRSAIPGVRLTLTLTPMPGPGNGGPREWGGGGTDGGSGDNWTTGAINRAKLQSNHHHQQTNIQFLQAGCPSCRPTNSVKVLLPVPQSSDRMTKENQHE